MGTSVADWDRLSSIYDRQLWLERWAIHEALELARATRETALLDAGTGTGAVLRALATRADPPRHVVGIDSSEAMLTRVGPLADGWRLVRADVAALPFDDHSFDTATAVYLLHVLSPATRPAALGELRRVLRQGGRLVTVTPVLPSRALSGPLWWALGELAELAPSRFGGMRPLDPRPDLVAAGFRLERARIVRGGYYSLCVSAAS
jgi:SAM-dependent methyltransferase